MLLLAVVLFILKKSCTVSCRATGQLRQSALEQERIETPCENVEKCILSL